MAAAAAAAALPDELVLEIIARLPPKYALQCSSLNKFFFHAISCPHFARRNAVLSPSRSSNSTVLIRCSSRSPKIYTRLSLENSRRRRPVACKNLIKEVFVLDSCYGILLLRVKSSLLYHVFNPVTGGIMPVDHLRVHFNHGVGLVVDFLPDSSFDIKLATFYVETRQWNRPRTLLKFDVLVPHQDFTETKSEVSFSCEGLTLVKDDHFKSVYEHGSMHWLANRATKIIAFNLGKEQARIIDGPVKRNDRWGSSSDGSKWFGSAQGSLSYVYARREHIVVLGHDALTDEWRVRYRIDYLRLLTNYDYGRGMPLFFDGRRLLARVGRQQAGDAVYEFDMGSWKWKKRGVVEDWADAFQNFFTFFPTLAKVSDEYLQNKPTHVKDYHLIKETLLQLQHLLRM